jgi:hypothetical protein
MVAGDLPMALACRVLFGTVGLQPHRVGHQPINRRSSQVVGRMAAQSMSTAGHAFYRSAIAYTAGIA